MRIMGRAKTTAIPINRDLFDSLDGLLSTRGNLRNGPTDVKRITLNLGKFCELVHKMIEYLRGKYEDGRLNGTLAARCNSPAYRNVESSGIWRDLHRPVGWAE